MPKRWLNYLMMSLLLFASVGVGCRAPYPTYNPYGFYGQPCVSPPGTGTYRPNDPYYGTPTNGVYPPNPYAPYPYPGYPPAQQPAGATSQRTWAPQASTNPMGPTVQHSIGSEALTASTDGQWQSVTPDGEKNSVRTASLDTNGTFSDSSSNVPVNNFARIDGFGRD